MARPPEHSRPPMASDQEILLEVDELMSDGQIDTARRVLDDALRSRPSGPELVQRRRALDQAPQQTGAKSGVVERPLRSIGFQDWHTAPPRISSRPKVVPSSASSPPQVITAPPPKLPSERPRSAGLKLWPRARISSRPEPHEPTPSDRLTVPPEMPGDDFEPAVGRVVAGKYRLDRLLKQGGMGSVWVATHLDLDRPVAIKFMSPSALVSAGGGDPSNPAGSIASALELTRARFEREARAAARIRSVNVVQVYDHGVEQTLPYIIMELLDGEDLGARLERQGRLSVAQVAALLVPIAHALGRAHEAGVVHRDLKPENIFLTKDGDVEVLKILDFGVSKIVHGADLPVGAGTLEGALIGTPFYMSPEQAMGRPDVDQRTDLWSLGIILFQALTGQRPFTSTLLLESVVQIASGTIPPPSSLRADLGPGVDAFFERALARDPGDRFQSAKEMASAFAALAAESAALANVAPMPGEIALDSRPPSIGAPSRRSSLPMSRRSPRRSGWLLPVGVLAVVGLGLAAWASLRQSAAPVGAQPERAAATGQAAPTDTAAPIAPVPEESPTAAATDTAAPAASAPTTAVPKRPARGGPLPTVTGKQQKGARDVGY